jgi:osmotically-inducible protein OsmY
MDAWPQRIALLLSLILASVAGADHLRFGKPLFPDEAYLADATVIARARHALEAEPLLARTRLVVEAELRDITLRGEVATEVQAEKAVSIVRGLSGVRSVTNALNIGALEGGGSIDPVSQLHKRG